MEADLSYSIVWAYFAILYFEITAHFQAHLPLSKEKTCENFNNNVNDTNEFPFTTRKFATAMSVAEAEAGEDDDLVRVPFSGPSGSTFRDYK